jgi:hypothetical protein
MSFELSELRDYWCIVSYTKHNDRLLIIQESNDVFEAEMFLDIYGEDLDKNWTENTQSGIYRLALDPVWETDNVTKERYISGGKPSSVGLLMYLEDPEEN